MIEVLPVRDALAASLPHKPLPTGLILCNADVPAQHILDPLSNLGPLKKPIPAHDTMEMRRVGRDGVEPPTFATADFVGAEDEDLLNFISELDRFGAGAGVVTGCHVRIAF